MSCIPEICYCLHHFSYSFSSRTELKSWNIAVTPSVAVGILILFLQGYIDTEINCNQTFQTYIGNKQECSMENMWPADISVNERVKDRRTGGINK